MATVGRHTAEAFGRVKSSIAFQRVDIQRRISRWLEAWSDRVTGQLLQIDENDLWIAAQAVERNFVVVTSDLDFTRVIAPAAPEPHVQLCEVMDHRLRENMTLLAFFVRGAKPRANSLHSNRTAGES